MRLQQSAQAQGVISGPLIVNSGFRSQQYNELLRSEGVAAARNSQHLQGNALDLTWSGFPRTRYGSYNQTLEDFTRIAFRLGFRRRGLYGSFIHLDIKDENYNWDSRPGG